MRTQIWLWFTLLCLSALFTDARAEPWIAVKEGLKCTACHVNPSGGGMRTEYGNLYAQMQLAATQLLAADADRWTGRLNRHVALGGNLRADARHIEIPNQPSQTLFELDEARLYLLFSPVPGRVDVYLDQRVAPGSSLNREAYARYSSESGNWYVKAGQMYLPYGLRLEDDSAFIRRVPGINFTTPDSGVEVGWEDARWSAQLALSNGTAGATEVDNGKQISTRLEYIDSGWRAGVSVNTNDTDAGTRNMQSLFAGLRTGPVAWLAEVDFIRDDSFTRNALTQQAALIEANWSFRQGHNLKVTAELLEPDADADSDERQRYSIYWEYFPFEFTQVRFGTRMHDDNRGVDLQNRTVVVLQLHGFF